MQGLRAEHEIHEGSAPRNRLAFLARHAATHSDHHVRRSDFSLRHSPSSENTFSCAFSRTETRVHQEHVRLGRVIRSRKVTASV